MYTYSLKHTHRTSEVVVGKRIRLRDWATEHDISVEQAVKLNPHVVVGTTSAMEYVRLIPGTVMHAPTVPSPSLPPAHVVFPVIGGVGTMVAIAALSKTPSYSP